MKHAFLIMAHGNYSLLSRLIKKLDHEDNTVFIHIDAKSAFTDEDQQLLKQSCHHSQVHLIRRYRITWGGYSQIDLELRLLEAAVGKGYDYYHYLSGADFLIKPMGEFHAFFEKYNGCEFVEFHPDSFTQKHKHRFAQYHFFREMCGRDRKNPLYWLNGVSVRLQKYILRIDRTRKFPDTQFRSGANWCSITHEFAKYLLSKEPLIRKMFAYSSCADEVFLQTVLASSPFADNVYGHRHGVAGVDACLRSIDWSRQGSTISSPHVYTVEDYEELMASDNLICRKVTDRTPEGEALIKKLEMIGN